MIQFIHSFTDILLILPHHELNCALEDENEIDDMNSDWQEMDSDDDDEFLDIEDDDFSYDDDFSWKVRRSTIRYTQTFI